MLMVMQTGLAHPPAGLGICIINSLSRDVAMLDTFEDVLPFLASDFLRVILLFCLSSD